MCKSFATWFGALDFDQIFAYSVPRTVSIRDRNLGLLQYAFMAAILGYVIGYTVVFEQRYRLIATDIFGSARLQLVAAAAPFTILPNETQYCAGSVAPYQGLPPIQLYPCYYLDEFGSVFPEEEAGAMLIATRITEVRVV